MQKDCSIQCKNKCDKADNPEKVKADKEKRALISKGTVVARLGNIKFIDYGDGEEFSSATDFLESSVRVKK